MRASAAGAALAAAVVLAACGTTGSAGPKEQARPATVPKVVGQPLVQADASLARVGLLVEAEIVRGRPPRNTVISQDPRAGTHSHLGATVQLGVSDGVAH